MLQTAATIFYKCADKRAIHPRFAILAAACLHDARDTSPMIARLRVWMLRSHSHFSYEEWCFWSSEPFKEHFERVRK